jgi:ProP effector
MIRKRQSASVAHPIVVVRKKKPPAPVPARPLPRLAAAPLPTPSARMTTSPRPARSASSQAQARPVLPQSETMPPQPNRRQRKAQAPRALLEVLRARWPAAFPDDLRRVRPLMRGVHREIAQRLPGTGLWLIKRAIVLFQAWSGEAYWRAILRGGPRYALDGSPCGAVSLHEQEHARQTLATLAQRRAGRRPAAATSRQLQEEGGWPQRIHVAGLNLRREEARGQLWMPKPSPQYPRRST